MRTRLHEEPLAGPLPDPSRFPDRDSLIRYLVGVCGWPPAHVARIFEVTSRRIRQLTTAEALAADIPEPDDSSTLTRDEMVAMARDYANDPYITVAEREAAFDFIQTGGARVA